jgi:hypothetical protein
MFKYTRAAATKIKEDLSLLSHLYTVIMQIILLAYFIVALLLPKGYFTVNIIGIAVTAFYLVFYLISYYSSDRIGAGHRRLVKTVVKIIKLSLSAFTLATILYSVLMASTAFTDGVTPFTLVTAPLMIIVWVLQVVVELIKYYATAKIELFVDGLRMDVEKVAEPITRIENKIHRFFGEKEKQTDSVDEKNREELMKRAKETSEAHKQAQKELWEHRGEVIKGKIKSLFGSSEEN